MTSEIVPIVGLFGIGVALVLLVGLCCVILSRNLIRTLIGLEILTKGVTLLLITAGYATGHSALAQALVISLIVIEVAVVVIAISLVMCIHHRHSSVDTALLRELKG